MKFRRKKETNDDKALDVVQVLYCLKALKKFVIGYSKSSEEARAQIDLTLEDCIAKCEEEGKQ